MDRDPLAQRRVHHPHGLAQAEALICRQRDVIAVAVVLDAIAAPHLTAHVDDLAGPTQRSVVRHAVEPLDHLRPRRAEAEHEPPAGQLVEPDRRHRDQRRRPRVDRQDARADLRPLGHRRQEPQRRHRVGRVRLAGPQVVDADRFEDPHLLAQRLGFAPQPDVHAELHVFVLFHSIAAGVAEHLGERLVAVDARLARQAEQALADDVALDLVAAAGDRHDAAVQVVDRRRARPPRRPVPRRCRTGRRCPARSGPGRLDHAEAELDQRRRRAVGRAARHRRHHPLAQLACM